MNKKIKIGTSIASVALAVLILGGCSQKATSSKNNSDNTKQSSSSSSSKASNYSALVKDLKTTFDKDNEGLVKVVVTSDVTDDTSNVKHTVIDVMTSGEGTTNIKVLQDALNDGSATDDQKLAIQGIRQEISDEAKKLDNDHDVLMFSYPIDADNSYTIAESMKTKDIIPIVVN